MGRRKRSAEEEIRRTKIRELLQAGNISSMEDIQDLFKETIAEFMETGLDAELDEELGYSKYDYRNKKTDNSRKVTKSKTIFPTDDSLFKMLYLAMMDIIKKWTGRRQDWGRIYSIWQSISRTGCLINNKTAPALRAIHSDLLRCPWRRNGVVIIVPCKWSSAPSPLAYTILHFLHYSSAVTQNFRFSPLLSTFRHKKSSVIHVRLRKVF